MLFLLLFLARAGFPLSCFERCLPALAHIFYYHIEAFVIVDFQCLLLIHCFGFLMCRLKFLHFLTIHLTFHSKCLKMKLMPLLARICF
jgi:hypothetical protein